MGGSTWEGHAPLKAALDGLASAKGVSANRVKAVATAAFQFAKDYKRVVHDVEIFLWKAEVEHRLAGLYAMDAIMRQSQGKLGAKDVFVKRFLQHMNNTIAAVKKIPADQQENVRHVIEEWQTRGYYTAEDIEAAGGYEYSLNNPQAKASSTSASAASVTRASPTHADPASKEKLASLLSIIKKQKELKEQGDQSQAPLLPTPQAPRSRAQESPSQAPPRRQPLENRPQGRLGDGYSRDQEPPRDRSAPRGRERSRSRDRGAPSARPRDRSRDRSRGRDSGPGLRDRRQSSPPRGRERREPDYDRRDSLEDSRDAKKPRSSRWGPPRPSDNGGGDDNRPPVIDTRDHERSTRFESRSPRNRFDGPPGAGPAPGQGSWPPTGYQGPPPPFRSGQPPPTSFLPPGAPGAGNGLLPPPRGVPQAPSPGGRDTVYSQAAGYPGGPRGPPGPVGGQTRGNDVPPHSGSPENSNSGDQPGGSGEVCRKFLAGRCTFGDRCWHVHNRTGAPQDSLPPRTHPEMNQAKRKTVLCANFPQGTCRFGDRCSFAHGEDDLDKNAMAMRRPPPMSQDPMRGGPSPRGASPHGTMFQPQVSPHRPNPINTASAYARVAPGAGQYGANANAAPPVYGSAAGDPQQAPNPSNQWAGAAAASGYGGYASAAPVAPVSASAAQKATPTSTSRDRAPSRDEDETDATGPEFTLQYDEDE